MKKNEMEGNSIIGKHDPFPKWVTDVLLAEVEYLTKLLKNDDWDS